MLPPELRETVLAKIEAGAAYRANWQKYEIRAMLGEGGSGHEVVIPAPEPAAP